MGNGKLFFGGLAWEGDGRRSGERGAVVGGGGGRVGGKECGVHTGVIIAHMFCLGEDGGWIAPPT